MGNTNSEQKYTQVTAKQLNILQLDTDSKR
jgi:hypothetical protein